MSSCKCCDEQNFSGCTCDHEPKTVLPKHLELKFQKQPKPKKKGKTKEEKEHLNWVASQCCMICENHANVHHIRILGEPRNHFKTIPLCYQHHQGFEGIHHLGKHAWREKFGHELDLLKQLEERKKDATIM